MVKKFRSKISKYLNNDQVTGYKYFHISNLKFTMKGCPDNFCVFRFFLYVT